ncbi:PAS domain S-box protein [Oscillatoria sp. FACHB-1406]|uniref:PAS domain S-box protein n=1 Tax=Oscillatoria sp. FACHB-1406 TaxID=2692846 RepID=UPI0016857512|nr:PAS domain S-box protein [Oscillatoria sp. FACHB-1406]MBD2579342.1 PAS domain S-box protein [Oscillatoria sp. FACHB-1406]
MKILVVEDDFTVAHTLELLFSSYNYAVDSVDDGESGLQMVEAFEYDLILLDVILPKLNGISLCEQLRSRGFKNPILLLTGQGAAQQKALALNSGADDYVVKPFDAEELIARVQALLRRGGEIAQPILSGGKLSIDPGRRKVIYDTSLLSVTPKEYAILELFLRSPQKVLSASAILDRVWTSLEYPGEEAVRVHIKELRQKLTAAGAPKDFIKTQHRVGYQLNPLYSSVSSDRLNPEPTKPKVDALTEANEKLRLALEQLQATQTELQQKNRELEIAHRTIEQQRQREKALSESEVRYRTLFEAIHEGVSLCEVVRDESGCAIDYRFIEINAAAEKIMGISRNDAIARLSTEMLLGIDDGWLCSYQQMVDSGESMRFEHYIEQLDRWFEVTVVPDGSDRFAVLYDEISDRKRSEEAWRESGAKYRSLFDSIDAGVCLFEQLPLRADGLRDYRYLAMNPAMQAMFGIPDLSGQSIRDNFPDESEDWYDTYDRVLETGEALRFQRESEPQGMVLEMFVTRVEDGSGQRLLAVMQDASERKQVEAALWESEAKLAAELAATQKLQRISTQLISQENIQTLYEQILDAAIAIVQSDMGSLQIFDPERNQLHLLSYRGFDPEIAASWEWVAVDDQTVCAMALASKERAIVSDVENCNFIVGTANLDSFRRCGIRSVQSTPLISRDGRLVGMFSTHWRETHEPSERELNLIDVLARQAADLIDRKEAEIALQESEIRFRHFAENSHALIWMTTSTSWANCYASSAYETIWGRSRQSLIEQPESWLEAIHPEDLPIVEAQLEQQRQGRASNVEYRVLHPDGSVRWISSASFPIRNETGETYGFGGIAEDISDRKLVENALKESEARFSAAFNHAAIGMALSDPQGDFLQVNPALCELTGYSEAELIGMNYAIITHPDDFETCQQSVARLLTGEIGAYHMEKRYVHKQGHIVWGFLSTTLVRDERNQPLYFIAQIQDISDRKQAEHRLRQQVQRERLVADIAGDIRQSLELEVVLLRTVERVRQALDSDRAAVFRFSSDGGAQGIVESVGEGWLSLLGTVIFDPCFSDLYAPSYLQGRVSTISDLDRSNLNTCYIELLKPLQVMASLVVPIIQGEKLWGLLVAHHCATPHHWQAWEVDLLEQLATHLSIAIQQSELYEQTRRELLERKAAEQKIQEQAALLDITSDAILVRDFKHRILYWNRSAERMYGWLASEALGRNANELLGENGEQVSEITNIVLELGEWHGELHKVAKTGREMIIEGRWTLARDAEGQPKFILCLNTDITEQKRLEAQFYRAQRLESLGTLASGIAHDLNNVLTPVVAISQVLRLRLPDLDSRSLEMLKVLEESAKRGAKTLEQILTFTRGRGEERGPVSIAPVLQEVVNLIQPMLPKSISIRQTILNPMLWWVSANSTHLQQVFMNLCVNARDAMPDGGILSLSIEHESVDLAFTQTNLEARLGDYVVVTVADTGTGIPPEVRDRIFEPFFTTKPLGQGTGLGLAMVLGMVKNYGGFVQVNSEMGRGTEVKVYLPALESNATPTRERQNQLDGGGKIIAVVDDDLAVLESTRSLLECCNYRVLSASSGAEAIALFERHPSEISAVIVDMTMPVMSGIVVIQRLKEIAPTVKIIAMSGLSANYTPALAVGANFFVSKPYHPDKLLERLQVLLRE